MYSIVPSRITKPIDIPYWGLSLKSIPYMFRAFPGYYYGLSANQ